MRRLIYFVLILTTFLSGKTWIQLKGSGQECNVAVLASDDYQTLLEITINGFYRGDTTIAEKRYNIVEIPGTGWRLTPGVPLLPAIYKIAAIPSSKDIKLTILEKEDTLLSDYYLVPGPSIDPENPDTFIIDENVYNSENFLPDSITAYYGPALWRDYRVIQLKIYPVQFNPVQKQIRIITKLILKIEYIGVNTVNDPTHSPRPTKAFTRLYEKYILTTMNILKSGPNGKEVI